MKAGTHYLRRTRMKKTAVFALMIVLFTAMLCGGCESNGITIPELNFTPKTVPDSEALAFTRKMGVGWNLGNTFDATGGSWIKDEMDIETAWQNDKTTEALIDMIHEAGFDTIRIPVSWHDHVDSEFNISERWLDRVREVADWAYSRGMYVIINIHHDCEKPYYYPSEDCLDNSIAYVRAIWTQLGETFVDYDEHLIFENLNEPRLKGTANEWNANPGIPEVAASMECINVLNQTFVDTVRAAGGKNADRFLMVSGYDASIGGATCDNFKLPADSVSDRLIVSTHAYIPYDFALQAPKESGSRSEWSILSTEDKSYISVTLETLYKKFTSKGIPVVMGEFGSRRKDDNLQSRVEHAAFFVAVAAARNIPCVWWDNNAFKGNGECFGIIRRKGLRWEFPELMQAMVRYKLK